MLLDHAEEKISNYSYDMMYFMQRMMRGLTWHALFFGGDRRAARFSRNLVAGTLEIMEENDWKMF